MPTVAEWIFALTTEYEVKVVSSPQLISDVTAKQNRRIAEFAAKKLPPPAMKQTLTQISQFSPSDTIKVAPLTLLHAIGRVTTPCIPNLADISSTWALLRYVWAFEPPSSGTAEPLRLSSVAREIDFHQKSLLSDELGIGITYYLMTNFFAAPNVIDVDIALRTPTWDLDRVLPTIPDYIFFDTPTGTLHIVECKGNQTTYSNALDQLRRGTEQVPSIITTTGQTIIALIVATYLMPDRTEVYIIDPPGDENEDGRLSLESLMNNNSNDPPRKAEKISETAWKIIDYKRFVNELVQFHRAKVLTFIGADAEALRIIPGNVPDKRTRFVAKESPLDTVRTDLGVFRGVTEIIPNRHEIEVQLFRGVLDQLYTIYVSNGAMAEEARILKSFRRHLKQSQGTNRGVGYSFFRKKQRNKTLLQSISTDGTMLQVTLSESK
ncbi:MAG TPA: hypothetical protein VFH91_07795 [Pyrinomonadaceae bacterium]|nr:hypothetical protein [Pyrinomonadaceae bacterium]